MSEEKQEQQEPEVVGPGALLKEARLKAGLSTAEIADKLHLKVCSIEDLESDIYDESISMTFTKGYLKLYAKQVHLPEAQVLEAFEKLNTKGKEPAKLQSFSRRVARQASDDRLMLVTYLIVFAVIALVVIWWWQQSDTDSTLSVSNLIEPQQNEQVAAQPTESFSEQAPQANDSDNVSGGVDGSGISQETTSQPQISDQVADATAVIQDGELTESFEAEQGEPAESDLQQPVAEAPQLADGSENEADANELLTESVSEQVAANVVNDLPLADPVELVFQFSGDCWMNLVDATGEAIAYGVKVSGRVMPVSGVPPFEVTLGAPESVQISYDGVAVDMSQFRAGRTARFTLPLSQ